MHIDKINRTSVGADKSAMGAIMQIDKITRTSTVGADKSAWWISSVRIKKAMCIIGLYDRKSC
ncbi:MAG: hypothetical protein NVSMB27_28900 [Ktedonobacteraceae bacterium]